MASGDGLIVRIHGGFRAFSQSEARAIGELAARHGNGQIELTRRANLQLRGVREAGLPALQDALVGLGLAAASPTIERRLSLLVSPLSEAHGHQGALAALARSLRTALVLAEDITHLPAKLGIVLDDARGALADVSADLRLVLDEAHAPPLVHLTVARGECGESWLGACLSEHAPHVACALLRALSAAGGVRMRELTSAHGVEGVALLARPWLVPHAAPWSRDSKVSLVGYHGGDGGSFGLLVPFGAADLAQWSALGSLACELGDGTLRLTHKRGVMLRGVASEHAPALAARASELGLVVHESDPLCHVIACSGAPACAAAFHETRAFARALVPTLTPLLARGHSLHVSGCTKGCAERGASDLTIVHSPEGMHLGKAGSVYAASLSPPLGARELHQELVRIASDPAAFAHDDGLRPTLESPLEEST